MSRTPVEVPDELFDRLRQHVDDAQLVELTHHIALENIRGRFNLALASARRVSATARVCPVPGSLKDDVQLPSSAAVRSSVSESSAFGQAMRSKVQLGPLAVVSLASQVISGLSRRSAKAT
jgi:hypothetical protein